ncbi:MAG: hypothetical protein BIP78_0871 [Candidatus Bipolaricaulis sibiricus]|uniref:Phospholipid/glycerol acyltransferase domain-containing protein n=1 Tax=Bipolaricaulis sibiricus TaxID=2501609 RepID=A0A410FU66_BIPS1|nr:MAG: hypothetical protein BIP78_0871 [Candidatus Bipolaricaulis sibiricus]
MRGRTVARTKRSRQGGVHAALTRLWGAFLTVPQELIRGLYVTAIGLLPLVARSRGVGQPPPRPCLLAVTHVGGFDVLFVARAARQWRMRAVFNCDDRPLVLRLLFKAAWRYAVSADPARKKLLNRDTEAAVVRHLRSGGSVMVFPEGHRYWERRLYPGVARIAYRAAVPIVPVGVANAYLYRAGSENERWGKAALRLVRETRRRGSVEVHFGEPLVPRVGWPESEEVDRLMRAVEEWFGRFYQRFYGIEGPTWRRTSSAHDGATRDGGASAVGCHLAPTAGGRA